MFIWDNANLAHIARHGISSAEVEQVITNEPLDLEFQIRNGEERLVSVGETATGRVLMVVTTFRDGATRVVTAFPAPKNIRQHYSAEKEKSDGEDPRDA